MIGTQLTIKNHDTGVQIVLNDHITDEQNVIALQSFPSFEADMRANAVPRYGAHGEYNLPHYYSGMSIVLQGVIVGETEADVWDIKDRFDAVMKLPRGAYPKEYVGSDVFPPMNNQTVRLSFTTPNGKNAFIDATPIKAVSYDRPLKQTFLLNFQVILRASYPYLLIDDSLTPNVETGSLGSFVEGFKLNTGNTKLPISLSNDYVAGSVVVTVDNPCFAILTMNGSNDGTLINPRITNLTNKTFTEVRKPITGANRFFKINGVYQTMTDENGASVKAYSNGEYVYLDAGDNTLVYTAEGLIPF